MREYQETYIENTRKVKALASSRPTGEMSQEEYYAWRAEVCREIYRYRLEDTEIIRKNLIPLLDNIMSAGDEDIASLEEFADALAKEQLENGLRLQICGTLVAYARVNQKRELLIKELYMEAMALYNFDLLLDQEDDSRFRQRMKLLFGEAAGYIRFYDEIEDVGTRGYIHRAMGNLALCFKGSAPRHAQKKLKALRESLQVLTDPVYQKKTPDLPWDTYIYKSHQERTTLLNYLRSGAATVQDIKEVMESAQFVHDVQRENARKRGTKMQPQWLYAYHAASYHCGASTLSECLLNLEKVYASVSPTDYSQQGMYGNVYLPAIYSVYLEKDEGMLEKKKPVVLMMYHRMEEYIKRVPDSENNDRLFFYIRGNLGAYIEYRGENSFRDYIQEMVEERYPDNYIHSMEVARISRLILAKALDEMPEALLGVRGCNSVEELREHAEEIGQFIYNCGMLHDIGKMKLLDLYAVPNREWISEEETLHRYHGSYGYRILERCESTKEYAAAALGHHCWYNGRGGYSGCGQNGADYHRDEVRDAPLVDIISIADYIDRHCSLVENYVGAVLTLDEALMSLKTESGTRFAPHFVEIAAGLKEELGGLGML